QDAGRDLGGGGADVGAEGGVGGGDDGRGRHGVARGGAGGEAEAGLLAAAQQEAVAEVDEPAGDQGDDHTEEDAGQAALGDVGEVDVGAEREREERDHDRGHRLEGLAPLVVDVADQDPEQERHDCGEQGHEGDLSQPGGADEQQGEEGAVVDGAGDVGTAVLGAPVLAGDGQPQPAVGVGGGGQHRQHGDTQDTLGPGEHGQGDDEQAGHEALAEQDHTG